MGSMPTVVVQEALDSWLKECSRNTAKRTALDDAEMRERFPNYTGPTHVGVQGLERVTYDALLVRLEAPVALRFREYAHLRCIRILDAVSDGECTVFACLGWPEDEANLWVSRLKTLVSPQD
jgi:hypothetical protein